MVRATLNVKGDEAHEAVPKFTLNGVPRWRTLAARGSSGSAFLSG
jgi:hypothetical protein